MRTPGICFEIVADDMHRARAFYENTFGWKITSLIGREYFLIETHHDDEPGTSGKLLRRDGQPAGAMTYIRTGSMEESLRHVQDNGGSVILDRHLIPGFGAFALFRDPEGNVLGLHEVEES
jgi:predicted enzyme related to lactoylglutathione lyase